MRASLILAGLILAGAAAAQAQSVTVEKPDCLPSEANGLVKATVNGGGPGQSARLYFRWKEHEDFYWVAMEADPGGRFWAVPPKPEKRNEQVEYYGALVDPAGKVVARSETQIVKVTADCKPNLGPRELGVAENLTVGETSAKQQGKKVMAFLCDGVVTRVNHAGVRRADEVCRACVIAWWQRKAVLIPAAGVLGVVVTDDDPEPSPARP
ncbi:MAG TPA: hypothetical protein VF789_07260 [Thermoanaerobaculia bacterium]